MTTGKIITLTIWTFVGKVISLLFIYFYMGLVYQSIQPFYVFYCNIYSTYIKDERLFLNHAKTLGFLASGGEEFYPGPETRLDRSELLCNKVFLKYKGDRESF